MVTQEERGPEGAAVAARRVGTEERPVVLPAPRALDDEAGRVLVGMQKCPYLAGRPPCGTHHLFPSGTNVCWADPGKEKPYQAISRGTQDLNCFGGAEGQTTCARFQQATTKALPPPRFERPRAGVDDRSKWAVPPPQRPRHRPGPDDLRSRLFAVCSWAVPLGLTALLLALVLRG